MKPSENPPICRYFESPQALIDAVDAAQRRSPRKRARHLVDGDSHGGISVGIADSWEAFKRLAMEGSPELAAQVEKLRASVDSIIDRIRARAEGLVYDVAGQWLDVGRFLDGEQECFGSIQSVDWGGSNAKVVRVDINVVCSAGVSQKAFAARGAAAAAFCDLVEASGRRVEIYALRSAGKVFQGDPRHQIRVKLKAANDPLDVAKIALAVADPGLYRRAMWSISEADGVMIDHCSPVPYRYDLLPPEQSEFADAADAVKFGHMHLRDVDSIEGFENFLRDGLKSIGLNVDGLFGAE